MTLPPPPTGLIDFFLHAPVGLLSPWLDYYGPYTGNVTLTEFSTTPGPVFTPHAVHDSNGLQVLLNGANPINLGYRLGWASDDGLYDEIEYDEPFAQIVVQHQFLNGAWMTTQKLWMYTAGVAMFWAEALPGRIGIFTMPGVHVDLFYLRTGTSS